MITVRNGARQDVEERDRAADVSVVMPCLNEEDSVRWCVERALHGIEHAGLRGEVVVCDNASVDQSVQVAERAGARVVHETKRGYGRAYRTGIDASHGQLIVIGDSDCSYDFLELHRLIAPLLDGYDYVLGSRFEGTILPGAMPFLNRYIGNPVLTATLNRLFGLQTSDAHSGMRAFTRSAYEQMQLRCDGMEFASEIVIAAARVGLRVMETPITYHPRRGDSKLNRWRDGFRHLRFMFAESLSPRARGELESRRDAIPEAEIRRGNGSAAGWRQTILARQLEERSRSSSNGRRDGETDRAANRADEIRPDRTTRPEHDGSADADPGSSVKATHQ
jgi:glycosyltransferase involved in cell wall biosynthesis